jgi:hypothetical protein
LSLRHSVPAEDKSASENRNFSRFTCEPLDCSFPRATHMPETVCNKIKRFSSSPMPRPAAMCQILATGSAHQKESAALFEHAEEFNFAAHVSLSEFENINDERVEVRSPCERSLRCHTLLSK